jgi:predicted O-methyltransferase YrrM
MNQLMMALGMMVSLAVVATLLVQTKSCPQTLVQMEPPTKYLVTADETKHPAICRYHEFSVLEFETRINWMESFLIQNNAPIVEGHSGQVSAQYDVYSRLFAQCQIKHITEIGFNAGHSTQAMFLANPVASIQSFDLRAHDYARLAFQELKKQYQERELNVIWGDSRATVPAFARTYTGPKFDLIIVDGGHSYEIAREDLINMRMLGHKDSILLIDDTYCTAGFCVDKAVSDLQSEGVLQVTKRVPLKFSDRGITLARYVYS